MMDKNTLQELLQQPLAQDLLENFGFAGKGADDFTPEEICHLVAKCPTTTDKISNAFALSNQ